ncbi:MAG: hypothetical protein ACTSYI_01515 [Promethearchaeota archaeon]
MQIVLSFEILNIPGFSPRKIEMAFDPSTIFINALDKFTNEHLNHLHLNQLAVISDLHGMINPDDVNLTVLSITDKFGNHLVVTLRGPVTGGDLTSALITVPDIDKKKSSDLKSILKSSLDMTDVMGELSSKFDLEKDKEEPLGKPSLPAPGSAPKAPGDPPKAPGGGAPPPPLPSVPTPATESPTAARSKFPSQPKSVPTPTPAPASVPTPAPKLEPSVPTVETTVVSPPSVEKESIAAKSEVPKGKSKKKKAKIKPSRPLEESGDPMEGLLFASSERGEPEILDKVVDFKKDAKEKEPRVELDESRDEMARVSDEVEEISDEVAEISDEVAEISDEVAEIGDDEDDFGGLDEEIEEGIVDDVRESEKVSVETTAPTHFEKSCAVDYYDVMNPEKYYPLTVAISDAEQEERAKVENLLTGERIARKVEDLSIELDESVVKVRPIFPGCSVTPLEMFTDLEDPSAELTFYITPLVSDEIEESRIEIVDSHENIIFTIECPCEVKDPRYSRIIAMYGIAASSFPKILTIFGIDAVNEFDMGSILPSFLDTVGDISLGNLFGIAGIVISLIVSVIVYLNRGEKSTRKSFKLSDLRKSNHRFNVRS